jgi:hypothetical protein
MLEGLDGNHHVAVDWSIVESLHYSCRDWDVNGCYVLMLTLERLDLLGVFFCDEVLLRLRGCLLLLSHSHILMFKGVC